jgi:hypothetical protein
MNIKGIERGASSGRYRAGKWAVHTTQPAVASLSGNLKYSLQSSKMKWDSVYLWNAAKMEEVYSPYHEVMSKRLHLLSGEEVLGGLQ